MTRCPGRYCGRLLADANRTDINSCGACPWGSHVDSDYICQFCTLSPTLYDWLYLGFMAMLPLLLNSFFIEFSAQRKATRKLLTFEYLSALAECILSAVISILLMDPKFSFVIWACPVTELADWYTMFYNPSIDYVRRLPCTQEAVYPLYSLPFVYYCFCLIIMILLRSLVIFRPMKTRKTGASGAVYAALYFYPLLIFVHATCAGLLYYSFPYILLVACLIANGLHLAVYEDQTFKGLVRDAFKKPQNLVVLFVFSLIYAYCVVSITRFSNVILDACLLLLIPTPSLFYFCTAFVTDPSKLTLVP